jgi:LacI family repressor for deo operon, udp, cdd, tsx, nupC, and nupG
VVSDILGSAKKEPNIARQLERAEFDGAILFTGRIPGGIDVGRDGSRVPLVLVCNDIPDNVDLPVFDVANRDAARQLISYLISIGHRRIAHIRGPKGNIEAAERLAGYCEGLAAAGIAVAEDLIWEGDFYLGSGIAAAGRYLACAERPTAVFAGNDQMAMGFITELKHAGISVPGDVSVAGFDDVEFSVIFDPPLTTMHQPRAELGRLAAVELLQRMHGTGLDAPPARVRLDCELVIRSSTQHIRQSGSIVSRDARKRRQAGSRLPARI